jgi:TRAP-type C4-dicarboxylate transport system permease small subunit
MSLLERLKSVNDRLSFLVEWIGLAGILLMMLITCIDVIGAKVFLLPVPGSIDIIMISQLVAISFAIAGSLILGRHVEVEFFVPLLPKTLQNIINCLIQFLGLFLFVMISWRLFGHAHSLYNGNEVSPTLRIPMYPFAYGAGLACIPVCLFYVHGFITSIKRIVKK